MPRMWVDLEELARMVAVLRTEGNHDNTADICADALRIAQEALS